jgi:hypothetical protein
MRNPENEALANKLADAIKKLAASEEHLDNFASYLSYHFPEWMEKYANTPENLVSEFCQFASLDFYD